MGQITAYYKIDSEDIGAHENLAYRNQASGELTTFPSRTKVTAVSIYFKGLRRDSSSGQANHSFSVDLEAGVGGGYITVWNDTTALGGTGGSGECTISANIASGNGTTLASTGISDIKLQTQQSRKLNAASGSTATATFTYESLPDPTLSSITTLSASNQTTQGKTTISWNACTGANGGAGEQVRYVLKKGSTVLYDNYGTSVTLNVSSIGYGGASVTLTASYAGLTKTKTSTFTFYKPNLSTPSLSLSNSSGTSTTLTWTGATASYTQVSSITYSILKNGETIISNATSPYTFSSDQVKDWGTNAVSLKIKASAPISSGYNTDGGNPLTKESNAVNFTYIPPTGKCIAPTTVTLDKTITNDTAQLSWTGAEGGENNSIIGYNIRYCESSDGLTWENNWSDNIFVSSSPTTVYPSSITGKYRKFGVQTCGSAGANYYSDDYTESSNTLKKDVIAFENFTDENLLPGYTKPKAIHITELQTLINELLQFKNKQRYNFSSVIAKQTNLSLWKTHIFELREAVDLIDSNHEAWIEIPKGLPSAAVMEQLRNIVLNYYNNR